MDLPPYRVAVITLSDRAFAGEREDESGRLIVEMLQAFSCTLIARLVLPDEAGRLVAELIHLVDEKRADLIFTTGGTGLGRRDITPEATLAVIDQRVPGVEHAMRAAGLAHTPHAMLSRAVAGVRNRTLIINLPGSPAGVRESLAVVLPVLPHALQLLRDERMTDHDHQLRQP